MYEQKINRQAKKNSRKIFTKKSINSLHYVTNITSEPLSSYYYCQYCHNHYCQYYYCHYYYRQYCHYWVVLMVTHRETASCFTKICKVSRKNQCSIIFIKDLKHKLKIIINKFFFFSTKKSLCFFIFHFGNSQRNFYHFLVSTNKILSKSNNFNGITIFSNQIQPYICNFLYKQFKKIHFITIMHVIKVLV